MKIKVRCEWSGSDPLMQAYHDTEWGRPEKNSKALFEKLLLDGFQAGLSWRTILHRREGMRTALNQFEPKYLAKLSDKDLLQLLKDDRLIKHPKKVLAIRTNAQAFGRIEDKEGAFSAFLWSFAPDESRRCLEKGATVPTQTEASRKMATALKKRGFSFCGPVICYAFMQAVGMVNDHTENCFLAGRDLKER